MLREWASSFSGITIQVNPMSAWSQYNLDWQVNLPVSRGLGLDPKYLLYSRAGCRWMDIVSRFLTVEYRLVGTLWAICFTQKNPLQLDNVVEIKLQNNLSPMDIDNYKRLRHN